LANLVRTDGDVEQREDFRRTYDEDFLNMRLEEVDGPIDESAAAEGEQRFVAAHPSASPPREDETAESLAGFHRSHLRFIGDLMLCL